MLHHRPQISAEDALKASAADTVYYGTQMRGVSNARAKRELNFRPRPLEWIVDTVMARAS
jgi:2-alkyl-3-oxoalkanoate reductase